ncbi:MAG: DeoR/GlpR transcriptional regulator [Clostridiales bacterium]|jgi:DeoR/GlpR family transcriptional regulator of sugar metabolism|nr:DeoR/GlpR transcriptional regulator [Clostridiales bacterium]
MFTLERQTAILEYLKVNKSASISDLSKRFFIGEATIRRDLDKLEKQKLVKRTYGGAVLVEGLNIEIPISVREKEQALAKDIIGRRAAELVNDGDIIIMDSSTTTYYMIPYLKSKSDITIITNGVKTATSLGNTLHTRVYCTGGKLRENSLSLVGQGAKDYIKNFSAQKLFFSCRGITPDNGAMDNSEEEAELRKVMMGCAEGIILLCDSSKLNKKAFYRICGLDSLHHIVTDKEPSADILAALTSGGIKVLVG